MTFRAALLLLAACAAAGCVSTGEDQAIGREMDISRVVVDNYRATYALGCARYNTNRVAEMEADLAEQRAILRSLVERRRQLKLEALHLRAYGTAPEEIRIVQAMNIEGEVRSLNGEIDNRRQVIAALEDRASYHRRQAASETRNIALILRNPAPGEGRNDEIW